MPGTSRPARCFLLAALFCLVAGATLSADAIGRLFATDGQVDHESMRRFIAIAQGALVVAGLVLFAARGALALHPRARTLATSALVASGLGAAAGVAGTVASQLPPAWERSGLSMEDRLARLAEAKSEFYGPTPDQRRSDAKDATVDDRLEAQYLVGNSLVIRGRYEEAAQEFLKTLELFKTTPVPLDPARAEKHRQLENQTRKELSGAYLRWGETDNCIARHNSDSCIFPVQGQGVHQLQNGSRLAMGVLRELVEGDPADLTSKWLYNVAAMTVGDYPDKVPPHLLASPELFASEFAMPRFLDRAASVGIVDHRMAGGVILEDFDLDGDLDVVASSMGLKDNLRYWRNEGDGSFVERTQEAGLSGLYGGLSISQGDYDNDGDADVSVVRGAWMAQFGTLPMSLLRNNRDGTFTDVTEASGLLDHNYYPGQVAEWADYDNDGWVDLFVGHESTYKQPSPSFLFHNQRDGTFRDVLATSGLREKGYVKGAAWGDYDDDGWIDLFVSRRAESSSLYHNVAAEGGGRRFEDVSAAAGIAGELQSFAAWFFDFDNDGDLDLYDSTYGKWTGIKKEDPYREPVTEIGPVLLGEPDRLDEIVYTRLYRNDGGGKFTNVAKEMGLRRVVLVMGSNFGDLDGDGWLDLYLGTGNPSFRALIPNKAFRNDQGRRFQDVTSATGLGHLQKGHAIAFGDVDNDGDEDVYADMGGFFTSDTFANALYENPGCGHRWLTLRLHGTQTNRRAIGARVRVTVATPDGPRTFHRVVGGSSSFGSSSVQQEVGLGDATAVVSVAIDWPVSRTTQTFTDLPLDRIVDLTEGDATPKVTEAKPFKLKDDPKACCPPGTTPANE